MMDNWCVNNYHASLTFLAKTQHAQKEKKCKSCTLKKDKVLTISWLQDANFALIIIQWTPEC